MLLRFALLLAVLVIGWRSDLPAATPDRAPADLPAVAVSEQWVMQGGSLRLRFNTDRLSTSGVRIVPVGSITLPEAAAFDTIVSPIRAGLGLRFDVQNGGLRQFLGGGLQVEQGFELRATGRKALDFTHFKLRADPSDRLRLQLIGSDGRAWFNITHLMPRLADAERSFVLRSADLIATAALAERLGAPQLAGAYVGELQLRSKIVQRPLPAPRKQGNGGPNFHGSNGYVADVLLADYNMQFLRCRTSAGVNGCNGVGGDDGEVAFAPSSTLRNSDNANTADVPWFEKFIPGPYSYPYPGNDQHPYLTWNLYRVSDGQLQQIAASGLKHAFLTTNFGCSNPYGNNILSRNCGDTYGTGSNDNTGDLGPRSELIPRTGRWGRCGSIFDGNCNGSFESGDENWICAQGNPLASCFYKNRLKVRESQLSVAGATYYSDSWYIVIDDSNLYNTMGHRSNSFISGSNFWAISNEGPYTPGPVIDSWVNPQTQPTQNVELDVAEGHVKVAVKTKLLSSCPPASGLSGNCYRYDYAVHNLDLARAVLNTSAPADPFANLQVLGNTGIVSVSLPRGAELGMALDTGHFADIDINGANDWSAALSANDVRWTAPPGNPLNWGLLFRFSVVSNAAPLASHLRAVTLGMPASGGAASYTVAIMVPNTFDLFADGLED